MGLLKLWVSCNMGSASPAVPRMLLDSPLNMYHNCRHLGAVSRDTAASPLRCTFSVYRAFHGRLCVKVTHGREGPNCRGKTSAVLVERLSSNSTDRKCQLPPCRFGTQRISHVNLLPNSLPVYLRKVQSNVLRQETRLLHYVTCQMNSFRDLSVSAVRNEVKILTPANQSECDRSSIESSQISQDKMPKLLFNSQWKTLPQANLHTTRSTNLVTYETGSTESFSDEDFKFLNGHNKHMIKVLSSSPFLYPSNIEKNLVTDALLKSEDLSGVLRTLETHQNFMNISHVGIAAAKLYYFVGSKHDKNFSLPLLGRSYSSELSDSSALRHLLLIVQDNYVELDDERVVSLLVHLCGIGLSLEMSVLQQMFMHVINRLDHLSLNSITKLLIFFQSSEMNHFLKGKFIPHIEKYIDKCSSSSELQLINYCILRSRKLLSRSMVKKHAEMIVKVIDAGIIQPSDTDVLLNTMQTISNCYSSAYDKSVSKVIALLNKQTTPFELHQLIELSVYCREAKLDRHLMKKFHEQAERDIATCTDPHIQAQLYLCLTPTAAQKLAKNIESIVVELLASPAHYLYLPTVYMVLRHKAVGNFRVIDDFWNKTLSLMDQQLSTSSGMDSFTRESVLAKVHSQYSFFNYNLGGLYRHREFEARMLQQLLQEVEDGASVSVGRLVRMASFIIGYSEPPGPPLLLLERLFAVAEQFRLRDVLLLTSGLQLSQSRYSWCYRRQYVERTVQLARMLSTATVRLAKESVCLYDTARLCRACSVHDNALAKFSSYNIPSMSSSSSSSTSATLGVTPGLHFSSEGGNSREAVNQSGDGGTARHSSNQVAAVAKSSLIERNLWNGTGSRFTASYNTGAVMETFGGAATTTLMKLTPYSLLHSWQMSSKSAFVLCQSYTRSGFSNVEGLESVLQYLAHQQQSVQGLIVSQALHCAYTLGHRPRLRHEHFRKLAGVIADDSYCMYGLQLLQAALSLCLYQAVTRPLIETVFSVEFLDQLEFEIQHCLSRAHYIPRVRSLLMHVNRSVCVDYPEARVPWFHEQYCHDHLQTAKLPSDGFSSEVSGCLSEVLGGDYTFHTNATSPYYYHMDFTFELDKSGRATTRDRSSSALQPRAPEPPASRDAETARYCILLLNSRDFSVLQERVSRRASNMPGSFTDGMLPQLHSYQLKGPQQLKCRHLELLGYTVLLINRREWQSMALGTAERKRNFLREKIWPKAREL